MSKHKKMMMALAKGGMSQSAVAKMLHVSKRDVSLAAKALREHSLTFDAVSGMDAAAIDELFFPKARPAEESAYLQPDLPALVERKKRARKIPVKLMWMEHCEQAAACGLQSYSYQAFCEKFSEEARRMDATRHFVHEPGEKCYVDWAGDTAFLTDKVTGGRAKVYVMVVSLPFSGLFWAGGFTDMRQASWQAGHAEAFESFGGVPRIFVPDNAATATDRSAERVTLVNREYERFADHYGAAVLPARVRKPRDKSTGESAVDLVERWVVGPSSEMTFYTLAEFNDFCSERVEWLNSRPFSAKDGSRREVYDGEEARCMSPLPARRYEMCEWRRAKVAPDYHVTVDYMHYSVPSPLVGAEVDVKLTPSGVEVMRGSERVAAHPRLSGRRGQYSTDPSHMPDNHREQLSPWSRERFESWADGVGPETGAAVRAHMARHRIVEQSFVSCRNILGLAKRYSPQLLESACARMNAAGVAVSYTACKNSILAEKGAGRGGGEPATGPGALVDNAKDAGRLRGADAYRRGGR